MAAVAPMRSYAEDASEFRWVGYAAAAVAGVTVLCAAVVAVELPFGDWDAMAFGTWSRLIAEHWPHVRFAEAGPMDYHRPFFYFLEGTLWKVFGFHQALGRLLSLAFAIVLAASLAYTAARGVVRRYAVAAAAVATALLLAATPFERFMVSGLSDVPVAAMVALTAALVWARRLGRAQLPLVALASALALLTKPSALASLAGLAAAILVGPLADLRGRVRPAAAVGAGAVAALVYDAVQAHLSHVGLGTFLTTGTDGFYAALAGERRTDTLLDASWLGADLRILLVFGVVYAVARLVAGHVRALVVAFVAALLWSIAGPQLAGHGSGLVTGADGSAERLIVLVAAVCLLAGLAAPADAIPRRLELVRGLVWLAPPLIVWAAYAVYDVRLLSAAWPPLLLLMTRAVVPALAGAAALDRRALWTAAAAFLALAVVGTLQLNGLGSDGWHRFSNALDNPVALRSVAVGGDFDAELTALAPQLPTTKTLVTADARLQFYYPTLVRLAGPTSCAQLRGKGTTLVLLESDEERTVYGDKAGSPYWLACKHPSPTLVAERPGAFAILTTGQPAAAAQGCPSTPLTGMNIEFGRFPTDAAAESLLRQAKGLGFVQAAVDQLGCRSFAVVETGIPSRAVGRSIVAEARSAHLRARIVDAGP